MGAETKLLLAVLLGSFGIVAPIDQFLGGLFLAIAAAFLVMYFTEPTARKTYALTLFTAVTCALIAGAAQAALVPNWSLHLVMAIAGGLSTFIVESSLAFGGSMKEQFASLPKRLLDRIMGAGSRGDKG